MSKNYSYQIHSFLNRLSKDKAAIGFVYEDSTPAPAPEPSILNEEEEEEEPDILSDDEVDLGK